MIFSSVLLKTYNKSSLLRKIAKKAYSFDEDTENHQDNYDMDSFNIESAKTHL
jgi:hypothetical protein